MILDGPIVYKCSEKMSFISRNNKCLLYYVNKYGNMSVLHIQPVYTTHVIYSTYKLRIANSS